jgi:hypothetical protein
LPAAQGQFLDDNPVVLPFRMASSDLCIVMMEINELMTHSGKNVKNKPCQLGGKGHLRQNWTKTFVKFGILYCIANYINEAVRAASFIVG